MMVLRVTVFTPHDFHIQHDKGYLTDFVSKTIARVSGVLKSPLPRSVEMFSPL
jgi:1,2-phenylacetyl-CoA epoxidase catalytic subunit